MPEEPHLLARPVDRCPACGSTRMKPVAEAGGAELRFLCDDCDRCWRYELGYVQRVNPSSCAGCPALARCRAAYAADHPR